MPQAFVAIGSNINPEANVKEAIRLLARQAHVAAISTFYRTKALDRPEQPDFCNGVVEVETEMPPLELKDVLRGIEVTLGRKREADRYAPRTIDLDLLAYDDLATTSADMVLPDPEIARRPFLAIPLYELAPDMILPDSVAPVKLIADSFAGHGMEPLPAFTDSLRKELAHGL